MSEINRAIGEKPALEWVPVDQIDVDRNYQRDIRPKLVEKILKRFSWAKFGAIVLARQDDGRFAVVEGQHRWKAATLHPDVDAVPAVIIGAGDKKDEAENFLAINRDRVAVNAVERYWAGLAAGDSTVIQISEVLKSAGCDVVPSQSSYKPNLTNAVGAIQNSLEQYGQGATRRALLVVRSAWPTDERALRGILVMALARIIRANEKSVVDAEDRKSVV